MVALIYVNRIQMVLFVYTYSYYCIIMLHMSLELDQYELTIESELIVYTLKTIYRRPEFKNQHFRYIYCTISSFYAWWPVPSRAIIAHKT